jgi:hypothetical protein
MATTILLIEDDVGASVKHPNKVRRTVDRLNAVSTPAAVSLLPSNVTINHRWQAI